MDKLREECGVFGIYDPKGSVANTVFHALVALQHRGQESCGIAVNRERDVYCYKGMGLVTDVFNDKKILDNLSGTMAVGHVRYATLDTATPANAQPLVLHYVKGNLAIAHNGSIRNTQELRKEYERTGAIYQTTSDTEIVAYTIARERLNSASIQEAVSRSMDILKGAYSLVIMSPTKLIAARDKFGFRPLCIGKRGDAYMFASESCALDAVGAEYIREVEPGEIIVIENGEMMSLSEHVDKEPAKNCIFEHIYFARPDSILNKNIVYESRRTAGIILAADHPAAADVVISVPDSGVPAAVGYAQKSGLEYADGFVKSRYIARTFIQPDQSDRELAVRMKLNPIRSNVAGKRVVVVDDSLVRGTTFAYIIEMLRRAGALEVHVRIASPPFLYPCYYGTDVTSGKQLVAYSRTVEEIRQLIGADSLGYLEIKRLSELVPHKGFGFCDACFTGNFPV